MLRTSLQIFFFMLIALAGSIAVNAQGADGQPLFPKANEREQPGGVKDMLDKLRIEKEKKEHEDMLKRGQDVLDLSDELEKKIESGEPFTERDREKLETLEKLVKKIRGELGGGDDSDSDDREKDEKPSTIAAGIKTLRTASMKLVDELKKTTRFSISAAAIQSSNSVLRLAQYLRFWR